MSITASTTSSSSTCMLSSTLGGAYCLADTAGLCRQADRYTGRLADRQAGSCPADDGRFCLGGGKK